ncbi:MAG: NAD-glutamate dehydrogenase [Hyphomicrobiales bacterium]|nr:NAD-glutamate dehydrogenase [Hyphomicrobiales bacterium]
MVTIASSLASRVFLSAVAPAGSAAPTHAADATRFAQHLLGGVDEAELQASGADDLARLAGEAFVFLQERAPGDISIRVYDAESGGGQRRISVIDIVNDDMPFLLDTVLGELREAGVAVHLVAHPIIAVERDAGGRLVRLAAPSDPNAQRESVIHIHVARIAGADARRDVILRLQTVLRSARAAALDGPAMAERLKFCIAAHQASSPEPEADKAETARFLEWIASGAFTLLGARSYDFIPNGGMGELRPIASSGLGLLRDPALTVLRRGGAGVKLTAESREFFLSSAAIIFTTANARSSVYRRGHMDSVGVKQYAADGQVVGEHRFVGFFSTAALTGATRDIPIVRRKVASVAEKAGHAPDSHSGKTLRYVLETFPRGELLQISEPMLAEWTASIAQLALNPRTRVFVREDEFGRFVSALVYVARDRYTSAVWERICAFLAESYGGHMTSFTPFFPEGPMVRLHIVIWRDEGDLPRHPERTLEQQVDAILRTWRDKLLTEIEYRYGDAAGAPMAKYLGAFPAGYEETNTPKRALEDIQRLDALDDRNPTGIDIFNDDTGAAIRLRATLHQLDEPIALSRRVPILENFGFNVISERTFRLTPMMEGAMRPVYLHDSVIETADGRPIVFTEHEDRLETGFLAIWRGQAANDAFNRLTLNAGLDWREAALMRAYGSYLRQAGSPTELGRMAEFLNAHPAIPRRLIGMFHTLFDPSRPGDAETRRAEAGALAAEIRAALDAAATTLEQDAVLRRFLNLVEATLRTNFYRRESIESGLIAFKLRSERVEGLPSPKPYAEIFVTSPRFEGVHLRGGPIARGGLRWSDRAGDFRTEVLSLAKAQQVKNTVIVPQGAKGGFVPRKLPASREAAQAEGVECYKAFISTLLSITDNLVRGAVEPPEGVVRHDGDDPYLVVAADKGTATFSDIANGIAVERGFWLGDAFASGGSAGYDHKKMAITARGGWEAVKRHFREMNIDIQTQDFRVIGVGDMSGDVFGNGMLLSRAIKLVAAFDHRDIFIDPNPDPAASWAERKRLFDLPRSSWQDYDRAAISPGGGVYSRQAKSIDLSPQARAMLGLAGPATPNDVMNAILRMEADLLWFGGIGTFVRATAETNEQAGDRANDAIRVTAAELRAKVVGEGANLGLTQRARIEYALAGGRINTDAIDNSAGVNSSDFEVNIKIAFAAAIAAGKLTVEERNALLADMTDAVADAVLRNNYLQTLAISLGERRGVSDLGFQRRMMQKFEAAGLLDRKLEALPSDAELADRRMKGQPLTRPELAVLLAYAKIDLKREILASSVPDDAYLAQALSAYFPAAMRERFAAEIDAHPLRREIIATVLTNAIINRGGSTFAVRLADETGHDPETIAYAFAAALGALDLETVYDAIDALDGKLEGAHQLTLYQRAQDRLRQTTAWFLRHGSFDQGLTAVIARYKAGLGRLNAGLDAVQNDAAAAHRAADAALMVSWGAPAELAHRMSGLGLLASGLDIVLTAQATGVEERAVARAFFDAAAHFRLDDLRAMSATLGQGDHFDRLAVNGALEAIASAHRAVAGAAAGMGRGESGNFAAWLEANGARAQRVRRNVGDALDAGEPTLAKLTVAASHIRDLL